jgi:hypothetical protein
MEFISLLYVPLRDKSSSAVGMPDIADGGSGL